MKRPVARPTDRLYRFGPFLLDPVIGRLHWGDEEVPLTQKTLAVLIALVERRSGIVDKDVLLKLVWPDTVVEENNLARCVSMLRKRLAERDGETDYIGTFSGRGYHFQGQVTDVVRSALSEPDPNSAESHLEAAPASAVPESVRSSRSTWLAGVAGVVVLVAGATYWMGQRAGAGAVVAESERSRQLWRFTSTARLEVEPAWSPDGRFIAFSSSRSGNFDLWVQPLGEGTSVQITTSTARDAEPAWSPDGKLLAFRSDRHGGGIFTVPALGGTERRLTDFGFRPQWSPDGSKVLFYSAPRPRGRVAFVVGLADGAATDVSGQTKLANPYVAWHPDGRLSAFSSYSTEGLTFLTMQDNGRAQAVSAIAPSVAAGLRQAGVTLGNFAWSRDGASLYFEGRSNQSRNLWRITVDPRTLAWIDGPERLTTTTGLEGDIALSPDGRRLAFSSRVEQTQAWAFPFDPATGRIRTEGRPVTPDGADANAFGISPDGTRLAYRTSLHGRQEVWIRSLTSGQAELISVETRTSQPWWSPDGRRLALLRPGGSEKSPARIVLVNTSTKEQAFVEAAGAGALYGWSADGRSVLIGCGHDGRQAICRMPLDQRPGSRPELVASRADVDLFQARTSSDSRWVSFIATPDASRSTVFVMRAGGGEWIPVTSGTAYDDKPHWAPDGGTLYFLSNRTGFFNLWGRRLDPTSRVPVGEAFQVTHFETPEQMVPPEIAALQIGLSRSQLVLPLRESSGAIWVMENLKP